MPPRIFYPRIGSPTELLTRNYLGFALDFDPNPLGPHTRRPGQCGQYGNVCFILVFSVSYYSQYEKPVRNTFREQRFRVRPLPVRKRPKPVRIVRNQYGKNKMKLFKTALGWLSPAGPWPVRTVRNQYGNLRRVVQRNKSCHVVHILMKICS